MSDLNLRIAISIHALREEGDAGPAFPRCRPAISIRTLCGEGNLDAEKTGVGVTISIYALGEEDDLVTPLRTAI